MMDNLTDNLRICAEYISYIHDLQALSEQHKKGKLLEYDESMLKPGCQECYRIYKAINPDCSTFRSVESHLEMIANRKR